MVGKESMIDKQRFGETFAKKRGVNATVFTDTYEAVKWLESS